MLSPRVSQAAFSLAVTSRGRVDVYRSPMDDMLVKSDIEPICWSGFIFVTGIRILSRKTEYDCNVVHAE